MNAEPLLYQVAKALHKVRLEVILIEKRMNFLRVRLPGGGSAL